MDSRYIEPQGITPFGVLPMSTTINTDNTGIWDEVSKTDPKYTKDYVGPGGFPGKSINAEYMIWRATQLFGPIGKGWGYNILEDRIDQGGPLKTPPDIPVIMMLISTIKIELWYELDGEKHHITGYGHTPFVYANKYGIQTDCDPVKKSLTDAIKKCLSLLGFSADIFLGEHDDMHYLNEIRDHFDLEHADDKIETKAKQEAEYREWKEKNLQLLETATCINELQHLFTSIIRKAELRKDDALIKQAIKVKDQRKKDLETKVNKKGAKNDKAV